MMSKPRTPIPRRDRVDGSGTGVKVAEKTSWLKSPDVMDEVAPGSPQLPGSPQTSGVRPLKTKGPTSKPNWNWSPKESFNCSKISVSGLPALVSPRLNCVGRGSEK